MINLNQHLPGYEQGAPIPGQGDGGFDAIGYFKDKNNSLSSHAVTVDIDNRTHVPLDEIPFWLFSKIKKRLTFPNPEYLETEKRGFSTWNIAPYVQGYETEGNTLVIPRGFTRHLIEMFREAGCQFIINDKRRTLSEVEFHFTGTLKVFQEAAVQDMLSCDFGTLSSPTGSGKTVMALAIIAARKQPTLIIVHTKELVSQWIERAGLFLGIPREKIGVIGSGKKTIGPRITIGIINSLHKIAPEIKQHFGHIVIDECHRVPSRTFTEGLQNFDSRYFLGLSATPWRRDKLSRLIYWNVGDVVHKIDQDVLMDSGDVLRAEVITRQTDFNTGFDPSEQYSLMLSELTKDQKRNAIIVQDVTQEARECSGVCLVLSDRKAHVDVLAEMIEAQGIPADRLTGDLSDKERQKVVALLNGGQVKVLVATGQLLGEGFDCKDLSTLFLATPIKFDGRLLQYLGRVLRPAPGKDKARVFDYVDQNIGVLVNSARQRQRVYERAA